MPHTVKRGDTKTLQWNLARDLTPVTQAKVIIRARGAATPAVSRDAIIEEPPTSGIVSLALQAADYTTGKLEPGGVYLVEIETQPGPLTHPDDAHAYERLYVGTDLG